jgi:ribosome-associated protein
VTRKYYEPAAPDAPAPDAPADSTSRSDRKRVRRVREDALSRLAAELCELGEKQLQRLELPEEVTDAIEETQRIRSLPARARQMRVVRSALRDAAWPEIRARLDQLRAHGTVSTAGSDAPAQEWLVRLLGEGSRGVDALLAEHPGADRKHLAALIRNAQSSSPERRRRAQVKLIQTLRSLLG